MVTTREPGDLPFENHAFPGGVLRQRLRYRCRMAWPSCSAPRL